MSMLYKVSCVCTAAAVLFVSSPSRPVWAAQAAPLASEDATRVLHVSVAPVLDGADRIKNAIVVEGEAQLDIQRFETEIDPSDPKYIRVEIAGEDYDYSIRVTADRGPDQPVGAAIVTGCTCSETDLVRAVLKEVAAAAQGFGAQPVPAAVEGTSPEPLEPEEPAQTSRKPEKVAAVGPMGWAGMGVAVAGAGLLGGGGLLFGREEEVGDQSGGTRESSRPTAIPLLVAGGVVVVVGAVLLAVDLTVLKKKRQRNVALRPVLTPTAAGFSLRGSF